MARSSKEGQAMTTRTVTRDALRSYVAQTLRDEDMIARIDQERQVAGSWVQRTLDGLYGKLADPVGVDWKQLPGAAWGDEGKGDGRDAEQG